MAPGVWEKPLVISVILLEIVLKIIPVDGTPPPSPDGQVDIQDTPKHI